MIDENKEKYQRLYYRILNVKKAVGKARTPISNLSNSLSGVIKIDGENLCQTEVKNQNEIVEEVYNLVSNSDVPYIRRKKD